MANITRTTAGVFLPEIWSKDINRIAEANLVLASRVKRFDAEAKEKGDVVHVPNVAEITAAAKAADTDWTPSANTETKVSINLTSHQVAGVQIEDIVAAQSNSDLMAEYTTALGYAIAKKIDTDLSALATSFSQTAGTYASDITDADVLSAIQQLDEANAPENDRYMVLKPDQKAALLALDKFVLSQNTGGDARVKTGKIGEVYGCEVSVTNQITVTSGTDDSNMVFQKGGLALAMQKEPRVQSQYQLESLATLLAVDAIYGVAELRDAFCVELRS